MATYKTLVTNAGSAALAAALAQPASYVLTQMAVGDGNGAPIVPVATATGLTNEIYRANIALLAIHPDNPNQLIAEFPAPAAQLEGNTVREVGLFDASGTLFAIANLPDIIYPLASAGMARDAVIRMVFEITNAANFTLIIDPNVVYATQQWVLDNTAAAAMLEGPSAVYPGQSVSYQITNYHSFYTYSVATAAPSSAAIVGDMVVLNVDATQTAGPLAMQVNCQGYLRSISVDVLSEVVLQPTLLTPASGEVVSQFPLLTSSAFAVYPAAFDSHIASQWQIATDPAFANIVADSGEDTTNLLSYVPSGLALGQAYFVRVRHKSTSIGLSVWSETVSFSCAGSDWLQWDGANDALAYQSASGVAMDIVVLSATDILLLVTGDGSTATRVDYLRRNGLAFNVVGSQYIEFAGVSQNAALQGQLCNGKVLFTWGATDMSAQLADFNPLLGTLTLIGTPTQILTGLEVTGADNKTIAIGADRFVALGCVKGYSTIAGGVAKLRGFYIDPNDNSFFLGPEETLGTDYKFCDITLLTGNRFVTAEHRTANFGVTLRTWEMPGVVVNQQSEKSGDSLTSFPTGGYNPQIQVVALTPERVVVVSGTSLFNGTTSYCAFFLVYDLTGATINTLTQYSDSSLNGPLALSSYAPGLGNGNRVLLTTDTSLVFASKNEIVRFFAVPGAMSLEVINYLGPFELRSSGNISNSGRRSFVPLTATLQAGIVNSTFGGVGILNGEV